MRPVHLLGMGLVIGAIAMGAMLAVVGYQWQVAAYPENRFVVAEGAPQPASAPVSAAPPVASQPGTGAQSAAASLPGAKLFTQKCAGCHTIGRGKRTGPDLKGVTTQRSREWLIQFITDPAAVIRSGDPTAAQLLKEYRTTMPNLRLKREQVEEILVYLEAMDRGGSVASVAAPAPPGQAAPPSAKPGSAAGPTAAGSMAPRAGAPAGGAAGPPPVSVPSGSPPAAVAGPQVVSIPAGDAAVGRAIFRGERPLANGGPACIRCHNVAGVGALAGGSWGLDLTGAHGNTGPEGILGILESPSFAGMAEAFASHPITETEAADLVAFFAEVDGRQEAAFVGLAFPLVGLVALAALIVLAQLAWRGRAQGVRRPLVGGG